MFPICWALGSDSKAATMNEDCGSARLVWVAMKMFHVGVGDARDVSNTAEDTKGEP